MSIPSSEWMEIAGRLEEHHAIFYKIWSIGKPIIDDSIETAAIQFDKVGRFVKFSFNGKFWDNLDMDGKLFVVCHEMLHVMLNHGVRSKSASSQQKIAANICMDIVINQSLVTNFGFSRAKVESSVSKAIGLCSGENAGDGDRLCWIDTIFQGKNVSKNDCYEYYFNMYKETFGDGNPSIAMNLNSGCLDDHATLSEADWKEVMNKISGESTEEEKESIKRFIDKHFAYGDEAGTLEGSWVSLANGKSKGKRKWESVIRRWEISAMKNTYDQSEQWTRKSRRSQEMSSSLFLPSEMETHCFGQEDDKIDVFFFMDTSGSCWSLKERFFEAARSLNPKKFNIRLFCFDTMVRETTIASRRIYGGGGTMFSILQKFVEAETRSKKIKHPTVFVITDGYGDSIRTNAPDKWFWFLTSGGSKVWIDQRCSRIYDLSQFE